MRGPWCILRKRKAKSATPSIFCFIVSYDFQKSDAFKGAGYPGRKIVIMLLCPEMGIGNFADRFNTYKPIGGTPTIPAFADSESTRKCGYI